MKGKLIIFEGIDGSGTTTQSKLLFQYLKKNQKKVILTKEPQNKNLIKLIKENKNSLTDLFLFLADRSLHYQKIQKWLDQGLIVISDRSFPSTLAYQYYASNLSKEIKENFIFYLDHLSRFHLEPDIVIILDIDPQIALKRLQNKKKKSKITKFENLKFLEKVRKAYLKLAKKFNWLVIDGSRSKKEIRDEILLILKSIHLLK